MDPNEKIERKKILMALVKKINGAKKESIKILRNTAMCDLKGVKRASKDMRDPNPLISTMATISQAYPITVDLEKAKQCNMPNELYMSNTQDFHQYGRVLCKKEAIDWWVSQAEVPSPEFIRMIDVLFTQCRKQVMDYYSIDWKNARISLGTILLPRQLVRTQEPICDIPYQQRDRAIIQVLASENVIPYDNIDPHSIGVLQQIKDNALSSKMSIVSQAQVLKSMLDAKVRCVPNISGMSPNMSYFRYSYCQSNFRIVGIDLSGEVRRDNLEPLLNFCKAVEYALWNMKEVKREEFVNQVRHTKILGVPVPDCLQQHSNTGISCVRFTRALLRMPSVMVSEIKRVTFAPNPNAKVITQLYRNMKGVPFKVYQGEERVNFKISGCQGQFTHNGFVITSIVCNKTSKDMLKMTLASIGVYCKILFKDNKESNLKRMQESVYEELLKNPWKVIRCESAQWYKFDTMKKGSIGELTIKDETEYEEGQPISCYLDEGLQIKYEGSKEIVMISPPSLGEAIGPLTEMPIGPLDDFLHGPQKLKRKVIFYHRNFDYLMNKLKNNSFKWRNENLFCDIPKTKRARVSFTARSLLIKCLDQSKSKNWHPLNICFWYCFAYYTPSQIDQSCEFKFMYAGAIEIDMTLESGALRYDKTDNEYYLLNSKYMTSGQKEVDTGGLLHGFLRGFKLSTKVDSALPMISVSHLAKNSNNIFEGFRCQVHWGGRVFVATKDSEVDIQTEKTITRQIRSFNSESKLDMNYKTLPGLKRPASEISDDETNRTGEPTKKPSGIVKK